TRSVEVQQRLAGTAQARYEVGLSPSLEDLDAERGLFSSRQTLLQAQATDLQDRVNRYLSLGGGARGPALLLAAREQRGMAQATDLQDRVNLYLSLGGGDLGPPLL